MSMLFLILGYFWIHLTTKQKQMFTVHSLKICSNCQIQKVAHQLQNAWRNFQSNPINACLQPICSHIWQHQYLQFNPSMIRGQFPIFWESDASVGSLSKDASNNSLTISRNTTETQQKLFSKWHPTSKMVSGRLYAWIMYTVQVVYFTVRVTEFHKNPPIQSTSPYWTG